MPRAARQLNFFWASFAGIGNSFVGWLTVPSPKQGIDAFFMFALNTIDDGVTELQFGFLVLVGWT
jgi:hypothetical protein